MPERFESLGVGRTSRLEPTPFGKHIRARRIELGLTQDEVARRAGMSQKTLGSLELGQRQYPTPQQVRTLAAALRSRSAELQILVPPIHGPEPKTDFGKFIRLRREERGLTQAGLARRLGVRPECIYPLERQPGVLERTVPRLARALELPPATLEEFVTQPKEKPAASGTGELVRSRRKELGLSQRGLARKLRLSWQEISNIELGKVRLSSDGVHLTKLARALKLDMATLEAVRPKPRPKGRLRAAPNTLGWFLARRRLELGLTQARLGERAQVAPIDISAFERGRRRPDPRTLVKISAALGCEIPVELLAAARQARDA